jgi:hypothetical protein
MYSSSASHPVLEPEMQFSDAVVFEKETANTSISRLSFKISIKDMLGDFSKQELIEKVASFEISDDVKY